jgi:beta-lactamase class C
MLNRSSGKRFNRYCQKVGEEGLRVAVRMDGNTQLFNYGMADDAQKRPVTADSIFNLGSVGKVFATTLLAQAVKQGELDLDGPVAKYVTELQRGGDICRITLGQLASHTSGLPRVPQQYETWHRGRYTWPDFVRFLNSHCRGICSGSRVGCAIQMMLQATRLPLQR